MLEIQFHTKAERTGHRVLCPADAQCGHAIGDTRGVHLWVVAAIVGNAEEVRAVDVDVEPAEPFVRLQGNVVSQSEVAQTEVAAVLDVTTGVVLGVAESLPRVVGGALGDVVSCVLPCTVVDDVGKVVIDIVAEDAVEVGREVEVAPPNGGRQAEGEVQSSPPHPCRPHPS